MQRIKNLTHCVPGSLHTRILTFLKTTSTIEVTASHVYVGCARSGRMALPPLFDIDIWSNFPSTMYIYTLVLVSCQEAFKIITTIVDSNPAITVPVVVIITLDNPFCPSSISI